jgi:hypothetical protein
LTIGGVSREVRATASGSERRDGRMHAVLRPDMLEMVVPPVQADWSGTIVERRFAGALLAYRVRLADDVEVEVHTTERGRDIGDTVGLRIAREPIAVVAD